MTFLGNTKSSQQMTNFVYLASIVWRKVSWSHRQLKNKRLKISQRNEDFIIYTCTCLSRRIWLQNRNSGRGQKRFWYYFVLVTNFFTHGDTLIRKQTVSCQGRNEPHRDSVSKNWDLRISNESVSMKGNGINKLMEGSYCHFKLKLYASQ